MSNVVDFYAYEPRYHAPVVQSKPATVTVLRPLLSERLAALHAINGRRLDQVVLDDIDLINTGP